MIVMKPLNFPPPERGLEKSKFQNKKEIWKKMEFPGVDSYENYLISFS
jgi:hypothetical protein